MKRLQNTLIGRISLLGLLGGLCLLGSASAYALPSGWTVENGSVTVDDSTPDLLTITASDGAIINFDSFSIAENQTVNFIQASEASTLLSRVTGGSVSEIFGTLNANGQIFLVNANGFNIGQNANISAGSLAVSTLDISNALFASNQFVFENESGASFIHNAGHISAKNVVLLSQEILNTGLIEAQLGTVEIAACEKATLSFDSEGLVSVSIDQALVQQYSSNPNVKNDGTIRSNKVVLTAKALDNIFEGVVNNTGVIEATHVVERDGVIEIVADEARLEGTLKADEVTVEANSVQVTDNLNVEGNITLHTTQTSDLKSMNVTGNLTLSGQGALYRVVEGSNITVDSLIIGQGATLQAPATQDPIANPDYSVLFTLQRDWVNGGSFLSGDSRVELEGSEDSHILGSNAFHDFYVIAPEKTVEFESGASQSFTGTLSLQGSYGHLLSVRSTQAGVPWMIGQVSNHNFIYTAVQDTVYFDSNGPPSLELLHSMNLQNNSGLLFQALVFDGSSSTLYSDPLNWSGGFVPGSYDSVDIQSNITIDGSRSFYNFTLTVPDLEVTWEAGQTYTFLNNVTILGAPDLPQAQGGEQHIKFRSSNPGTQYFLDFGDPSAYASRLNLNRINARDMNLIHYLFIEHGVNGSNNSNVLFDPTFDGGGDGTNWSDANNWDGDTLPDNQDAVLFNGTYTGNITIDNVGTWSGGNFTIASGYTGTITLGVGITVGNMSIANGTLNASTFNIIVGGSSWNQTGGTFTAGTGAVSFQGTGGTITSSSAFNDFEVNAAGNTWTLGSALDIAGMNIAAGTLDVSGSNYQINVGGSWIMSGAFTKRNGLVVFDGGGSIAMSGNYFYHFQLSNNTTATLDSAFDVDGDLTIDSGSTLDVSVSNYQVNVGGDWNGLGTFMCQAGLVVFDANGAITGGAFYDMQISNNATMTLNSGMSAHTLTIDSGSTLDVSASHYQMNINGDFINSGTFTFRSGLVVYDGTGTATSANFYNLQVSNNSTLTLGSAITVSNDLTIDSGSTLDVSGSNYQINVGGDFSNSGTFNAQAGVVYFDGGQSTSLDFNVYDLYLTNSTTLTLGAAITLHGINIDAGSTLDVSASNFQLDLSSGFTNNGTFNPRNGLVVFNVSEGITGGTFYNLQISNNSTMTLGSNLDVDNDLTIDAGSTLEVSGSHYQVNVGGTWANSGTLSAQNGLVVFDGGQTLTLPTGITFYSLRLSGNTTMTLGANLDLDGDLVIDAGSTLDTSGSNYSVDVAGDWTNAGTFTANSSTVTLSGTGSFSGGANGFYNLVVSGSYTLDADFHVDNDLTLTGTLDTNAAGWSMYITGNWDASGGTLNTDLSPTLHFNAVSGTKTLNFGASTYGNISFENGGGSPTYEFQSALNADGTITIAAGATVDVKSGSNFQINVATGWDNSGTFVPRSGIVVFDGTGTIAGGNFYDLQISAGCTATLGSNLDVDNDLTIGGTATLDVSGSNYDIAVGGDWSNSGTFTYQTGAVVFDGGQSTALNGNFYLLELSNNTTITLDAPLDVNGALNIGAGSTLDVSGSNYQLNVAGDFANSGSFIPRGGLVVIDGTSTVTGGTFYDFQIASGGTVTLGSVLDADNDITIDAGATLNAGGSNITIGGDWSNAGTFTPNIATVVFDGGQTTALQGNFYDLQLSNNTTINPSAALDIDGSLTIDAGSLLDLSGASYQINVGVDWINNGTFIPNAGLVVLDGAGTVTGGNFYALQISNNSTVTLGGALDVNNDLTIDAGSTLDVSGSNHQINVGASWINAGTFNPRNGSVVLDGSGSVSGGTFYNFQVSNNSTATLGSNFDVDNDLTIDAGSTLDVSGSNYQINVGGGFSKAGTFNAQAGVLYFDGGQSTSLDFNVYDLYLTNSTTLTLGAAITLHGINIDAGSTLDVSASNFQLDLSSGFTNNGTFNPRNGLVVFNVSEGITGGTFYNLQISNNSTMTLGSNLDVDNDLTIDAGSTLDVSGSNYQVYIGRDFIKSGTFTARSGLLVFDGGQTITAPGLSIYDLQISNNSSVTLGAAISVHALTIDAGSTLDVSGSSYQISVSGDWTNSGTFSSQTGLTIFTGSATVVGGSFYDLQISGNSTMTLGGAMSAHALTIDSGSTLDVSGSNYQMNISGDFTNSGTFAFRSGLVVYDGPGTSTSADFYSLQVSNNAVLTLGSAITVQNDLTIDAGSTLDVSGSDYQINVAGDFANAGTFNARSGLVVFDGGQAITLEGSFFNLQLSSNTTITLTGALDLDGGLTIDTGSTLGVSGSNYQVNIGADFANAGTFVAQGGLVVFDGGSTSTVTGGNFTDFQISNNTTVTLGGALVVGNDLSIDSGSTLDVSGADWQINVGGDWSNGGTFSFQQGAVIFDGGGSSIIILGGGFYDLQISNNTTVVLGIGIEVAHLLTIDAGSELDVSGDDHQILIDGSWTNNGTFTAQQGTVTFQGDDQTINGSTTFYNLTKTGSGGSITFANGSTQTILGALTLQGDGVADLVLQSDSGGTQWSIDPQGTRTISNVDVIDSNNIHATVIDATDGTSVDSGNNTNWDFVSGPTITGTVFTDFGVTNIGAGKTIAISINGAAADGTDDTDGSGAYSITLSTALVDGDIITIYIDGEAEQGVTVQINDAATYTGLDVYQNYLLIRQDGTGPATNTTLNTADANGDGDISAIYGVSGGDLTMAGSNGLAVMSGTFTPGGDVTTTNMLIAAAGTFSPGANTVTVGGLWEVGGTFTAGTSLVVFNGTTTLIPGGQSFYDVQLSNNSTVTLNSALDVDMSLTIDAGSTLDVSGSDYQVNVGSDFNNAGTFTARNGLVVLDGSGALNGGTFYNLQISNNSTVTLASNLDVDLTLTIDAGSTLDVSGSNYQINIAGDWTNNGTFTAQAGSVVFDGGDQSLAGDTTFYDLTKIDAADDSTDVSLTFEAGSTFTVTGLLTINGIDADDRVNLLSSNPGTRWDLVASGTFDVDWIEITDSDATGGLEPVATNAVDGGNNLGWDFGAEAPAATVVTEETITNELQAAIQTTGDSGGFGGGSSGSGGSLDGGNENSGPAADPYVTAQLAGLDPAIVELIESHITDSTTDLVMDGSSGVIYIADGISDSIVAVSSTTGDVVNTFKTGSQPSRIVLTPDGNFLFVFNRLDGTVSKINTKTGTAEETIEVEGVSTIGLSSDGRSIQLQDASGGVKSTLPTGRSAS